jgi:hypothetical protein
VLLERQRRTLEREPDARRRRQKAYGLLARHGFDGDASRDAIRRWDAADLIDGSDGDGIP